MTRNLMSLLYCGIIFILLCSPANGSLAPTNLLTTRVGPCTKGKPGLPVSVSEMSIYTRIYDSSVTGRFNVSEPIDNGWHVKATMQKCQDIRNLDTCDPFRIYPLIKSACTANSTAEDEDLYGMIFHHTTPRISCPVKPGKYKIVAYPFFTEDNYRTVSEAKISTSVFGYTYRIEGFHRTRTVSPFKVTFPPEMQGCVAWELFCVEAFLQLLYVREHNWMSESPSVNADADVDEEDDEDHEDIGSDGDGEVYT